MDTNKKQIEAFLAIPEDSAVLEEQYFERSREILRLRAFLKDRGLLLKYEQALSRVHEQQ